MSAKPYPGCPLDRCPVPEQCHRAFECAAAAKRCDRFHLALKMIALGCADPREFAQKVLADAAGSEWLPMESYPDKGHRDSAGKWHDTPGPIVDLMFIDGRTVTAQWRGERTRGGGETWAFWEDGVTRGIGLYDPIGWKVAINGEAIGGRDDVV